MITGERDPETCRRINIDLIRRAALEVTRKRLRATHTATASAHRHDNCTAREQG
ncbi:MAG: hypothetical protein H0U13_04830 [Gemmatimonadaceae bacterium]|nr:hypothetical protein [Gemmatimonadaceae bacterium]